LWGNVAFYFVCDTIYLRALWYVRYNPNERKRPKKFTTSDVFVSVYSSMGDAWMDRGR
jgi:hypothetical protein